MRDFSADRTVSVGSEQKPFLNSPQQSYGKAAGTVFFTVQWFAA